MLSPPTEQNASASPPLPPRSVASVVPTDRLGAPCAFQCCLVRPSVKQKEKCVYAQPNVLANMIADLYFNVEMKKTIAEFDFQR